MADFKTIFADEIRRLARKEIKTSFDAMKKMIGTQKQIIAALTARVKQLEVISASTTPQEVIDKVTAPKKHREFKPNAARIIKIRRKLGLSQKAFALLLDVNQITISHWEQGKNTPRDAQKERLEAARKMNKRSAAKLLKDLNEAACAAEKAAASAAKSAEAPKAAEAAKPAEAPKAAEAAKTAKVPKA